MLLCIDLGCDLLVVMVGLMRVGLVFALLVPCGRIVGWFVWFGGVLLCVLLVVL